ncbi:tyrosine-type recombinase/integrase [Pseudonocardia broussonetiae]|uniref:Tyrosine-type recombinase/integrase n=1 Tax=Pseudonocardia broussonetiae TaxID=2736640 RepID=A0A6M6JKT4_9PSEU|nr:tyrosine-type recombinase/integrase [Pseudonocardia broussonetiae]QJY47783.1 tyrosine-type recombinase/integrase [Pseudonocardia broussonetiae]
MAHITPTPAGSWRANWRDPSGRQRAKTFATKRDAKRFLAELETSLTRGLYVDPHAGRMLLAPYATRWLSSRNDEITTRARDASVMRTHVLPAWGTWALGRIDHTSVQEWISDLGQRRSAATVAEAHRLLSAVLRAAVRDRKIAYNPCDGVKVPRRRKRDTADQIVERNLVRHRLLPVVPLRYRALIATAAGTGMRWGELAGLCDDAIDDGLRTVRVVRTVVEVSGTTTFKPFPKSAAGRRVIPVPSWVRPILATHLEHHPLGDNGLIFGNQVGRPLRRTLFRIRVWRPALVRAGLLGRITHTGDDRFLATWVESGGATISKPFDTEPAAVSYIAEHAPGGLRFHDLRHSYATWLVDDGVPINMVQRVMGHERSSTTLDLYTRRTDNHHRILQAMDDDGGDPDTTTLADFPLTPTAKARFEDLEPGL